eukprot:366008-Chlamydomonas_euryale.AAC.6
MQKSSRGRGEVASFCRVWARPAVEESTGRAGEGAEHAPPPQVCSGNLLFSMVCPAKGVEAQILQISQTSQILQTSQISHPIKPQTGGAEAFLSPPEPPRNPFLPTPVALARVHRGEVWEGRCAEEVWEGKSPRRAGMKKKSLG